MLKISDAEIKCEEVVKLLGIDIDYKLSFDQHISNLCRKAGQQLLKCLEEAPSTFI